MQKLSISVIFAALTFTFSAAEAQDSAAAAQDPEIQ